MRYAEGTRLHYIQHRTALSVLVAVAVLAERAHCWTNCTVAGEDETAVEFSCDHSAIASIDWAHFGTVTGPDGPCSYDADPACDLDVLSVYKGCNGKQSCKAATAAYDSDPCPTFEKRTVVKFSCYDPPRPPLPPLEPRPSPLPKTPPVLPPPPAPPGSFRCAKLPLLVPPDDSDPKARSTYVSFRSIADFSVQAPGYDPTAPVTTPFDCVPSSCRSSAADPEECLASPNRVRVEVDWDGRSRTPCGEDYKGWGLDYSDVVIGVSVHQSFLERIDEQVGMGDSQGKRSVAELGRKRAALDLKGAWWNVTGFRRVNLLVLDQCTRQQWLHDQPGRCAHTDTITADLATLHAAGVESIRYDFWNRTDSKLLNGSAEAEHPDWNTFEADKTRHLMLNMLAWKPDAHFYVKVDTDVILYPERLLQFLRTLEAAIGTEQPAYFGSVWGNMEAGVGYMQGATYGFNGAQLRRAKHEGRLSVDHMDRMINEQILQEDRVAGWWGATAYHFHCGQFFPGIGQDYTVRVNRMRSAISYHHLLPAMLKPLGLSSLDPEDICLAPELIPFPPSPPMPPWPNAQPSIDRRFRGAWVDGRFTWYKDRRGIELAPLEASQGRDDQGLREQQGGGEKRALSNRGGGAAEGVPDGESVQRAAEGMPPPPSDPPPRRRRRRRLLTPAGGEPQSANGVARPPRNDWFCPEVAGAQQVKMVALWEVDEN